MRSASAVWWACVVSAVLPSLSWAIRVETLTGVLADGRPVEVVAGQVLVRFSTAAAHAQARAAALESRGGRDRGSVGGTDWALVDLPPGMKVSEGLGWVKALPGALAAEPNHVMRPNRTPNDPIVSSQWALRAVNAFGAWEYETGGSSRVTVAVIDAGIDAVHPDLSGKLVGTSRFYDPDLGDGDQSGVNQPPTPACNHATRVAGVAGASSDNGLGIAGMSWGAGLLSLKVFEDNDCDLTDSGCGLSGCATSIAAVVAALNYARTLHNTAAIGKIVVNMSIGDAVTCPGALQAGVTDAVNDGLLLVASAGNDGSGVMSPANCTGVMPVGATDENNAVASFSSRGSAMASYGLVAPGVIVVTSTLGDTYAGATGTSFSAPMVSGAAALVWSARPEFTAEQVKQTLRLSADNIGAMGLASVGSRVMGDASGAGRLNAFRAMRLAVRGTLADFEGDAKAIAFPNPFRPGADGQTTLTVPLEVQGSRLSIKVYDAAGRLVRELSSTSWDGKNTAGARVASGVYTFFVSTDKGSALGRLTVVR